ncbi:hypothetical protein NWP22_14170 [Anabaenopsis tanganyikae CS-531]|uniref:Uncharacterized protein n=2 Tax=Anabaenopsis TaxID=110103 RepID=A0ABT6KGL2_9CYAN|nr:MULTISPECIES: hypothetical protein [Nostocales]MDB9540286.1 hypothetical protein [Anabaenopsis arnoldii]MDH6100281.1 hypothetical protein [Anabaenopsis sp. FSS-46]MDH6106998.1 hypothetical protein [Anabaenopsis tanganyikae CS-531]
MIKPINVFVVSCDEQVTGGYLLPIRSFLYLSLPGRGLTAL